MQKINASKEYSTRQPKPVGAGKITEVAAGCALMVNTVEMTFQTT
jgi:hypothetical protein